MTAVAGWLGGLASPLGTETLLTRRVTIERALLTRQVTMERALAYAAGYHGTGLVYAGAFHEAQE